MGNFYLDIETTGLDPKLDKIITIQYQELERNTGEAKGNLVILKEWESSEKDILKKFILQSRITDVYPFTFIPTGYNLGFEHRFLKERAAINRLGYVDILSNPFIDLRSIGILMNRGEFKGSGLDKFIPKFGDGSQIVGWYNKKEFDKIIKYIEVEAREFIKLNKWLYQKLPALRTQFKEEK